MKSLILSGVVASLLALAADQASKLSVLAALARGEVHPITPFFNLRLGYNSGVSFGMFAESFAQRPLILAAIAASLVILLAIMLARSSNRLEAISLGAMIGGAVGNIADRLRLGAVVDFLDFHAWSYHWPAFNLADVAIVLGVSAFVLSNVIGSAQIVTRKCTKQSQ